jgi:hypothetical protein
MGADEGELLAAETGFVIRTPQARACLPPMSPSSAGSAFLKAGCPHEKAREWLAGGVQVVWVVDPQQRAVTVWDSHGQAQTLTERDILYGAPVLPNLQIPVRELFG